MCDSKRCEINTIDIRDSILWINPQTKIKNVWPISICTLKFDDSNKHVVGVIIFLLRIWRIFQWDEELMIHNCDRWNGKQAPVRTWSHNYFCHMFRNRGGTAVLYAKKKFMTNLTMCDYEQLSILLQTRHITSNLNFNWITIESVDNKHKIIAISLMLVQMDF